jgi:hypothetical protein
VKVRRGMVLLLALGAGWALRLAGATSNTVGVVRVSLEPGKAVALADAFVPLPPASAVSLTTRLGAQAVAGDLLHVWTGRSFNTYSWSGAAWLILGTTTAAPETRLSGTAGAGCLLTREATGNGTAVFSGEVPAAAVETVSLPATGWSLVSCPYPVDLRLPDLTAAGAHAGDQAKLWDVATQTWQTYEYAGGAWSGLADAAAAVVPACTAFLYYSAGEGGTALTFRRP